MYTHTHRHTHRHTHTHTGTRTCVRVRMRACSHKHAHTYMQTSTHACARVRVCARPSMLCVWCVRGCVRAGHERVRVRVCDCRRVSQSVRVRVDAGLCARVRECARVWRQRPCGCVGFMREFACALVRAFVCARWCVSARACARARVCMQACACGCVLPFHRQASSRMCCVCVCGTTGCVCYAGAVEARRGPAVLIARPAAPNRNRACAVAVRCDRL